MNLSEIHEFAQKWLQKFNNQRTDSFEFVQLVGEDCSELGFVVDQGEAFSKEYGPPAFHDADGLRKVIDQVNDIMKLGSAIYSKWRFLTYWASYPEEIMETKNRLWFILALERLSAISDEGRIPYPLFYGNLRKLRIETNVLSFGLLPSPDDEIEQHLTILADGRVYFSSYAYGDGNKYRHTSTQNFKTDTIRVQRILTLFEEYFSFHCPPQLPGGGIWKLTLENEDGEVFHFFGSVNALLLDDGTELSEQVRDQLNMQNLFALDGNKWDQIDRIEISYSREKEKSSSYTESLILDRKTETATYEKCKGFDYAVSKKFYIPNDLSIFLDAMDAEMLFKNCEQSGPDETDDQGESGVYRITVTYKKQPAMSLAGRFSKNGLPEDFPGFITAVKDLLHDYEHGDLFDPVCYDKVFPRDGELIFCSVGFEGIEKSYYYLTENVSINVGDDVYVPFGPKNKFKDGKIVKIECFPPEKAPFPVEKMKKITGKTYTFSGVENEITKGIHWHYFLTQAYRS